MKTIQDILTDAEHSADNIEFLCSISQKRFDCILRAAEALKRKIVVV
tara:strand:+ start:188 stop:328 length:141 start_codon:yes stop_codon:yes gene_type:complete